METQIDNQQPITPPVQPPPQPKKWYADKAVMAMLILVILAALSLTAYFILNQPQNLGPVVVNHRTTATTSTPNSNLAPAASPSVPATATTSNQSANSATDCATATNQAYCYGTQAVAQKNPAVCKLASSQDVVAYCYLQVATETNNLQLCPQIQIQNQKDSCYNYFASTNKDSKLCSMIVDLGMRQGCLMPFQQAAAATTLNVNLDTQTFSGNPGDSVKVTGQIQNSAINTLYLNGINASIGYGDNDPSKPGMDLSFDPTDFLTLVPPSFQPGQSYQGPIFEVQISPTAKPGTYVVTYNIQGGKTEKDTGQIYSEQVLIKVQ